MRQLITDDLDALLDIFPAHIRETLYQQEDVSQLLEVVMDLGRPPEGRFPQREVVLSPKEVSQPDIEYVVSRIGSFTDDNRAGIARTLHRISAIRNRQDRIVGLTCRVGRAVFGTMKVIEDIIETGKSVLLLGRPGIGKTTMLREIARVLADNFHKRVIIVDTSNEIAGDGDIPHPAIGHARRMQVKSSTMQHAVMIEAVENHMPEVIIIDEIGTEEEAQAARTIAERGVQLVGTAHGNTLDNLIINPTLSDLIGGIQSVTLGDEEAKRRGTQKSILERKSPPTFDVVVEIQDRTRVAIHTDAGQAVDAILRDQPLDKEIRWLDENGEVHKEKVTPVTATGEKIIKLTAPAKELRTQRLFLFGVNRGRFEQMIREMQLKAEITDSLKDASLFVTLKSHFRRRPQKVKEAEAANLPIYVLRANTPAQIGQLLNTLYPGSEKIPSPDHRTDSLKDALNEAQEAVDLVKQGQQATVDLSPQGSYIRRLQHLIAEKSGLPSQSSGQEPGRRVKIFKG
ncbi:MAG: R3H domain-containing nucleic acid-binding protein [Dehalococcoidales bacterium]|nr:R3H domain-containing nucleic acid-binding protein [Dehalococcoidales bacterium]